MVNPLLLYSTNSKYPDEVAATLSFAPSFGITNKRRLSARLQIFEDEIPTQQTMYDAQLYHFTFILDNTSLKDEIPFTQAKEALIIFLRNMPVRSKFTVIFNG